MTLLERAGDLRVLRHAGVREALIALLSRVHVGSDGFGVKAEAQGADGRIFACSVTGRSEGRATGVVAALVAESLYASPSPKPGVFHIEELFASEEFLGRVADYGFSVVPDLPASTSEIAPVR